MARRGWLDTNGPTTTSLGPRPISYGRTFGVADFRRKARWVREHLLVQPRCIAEGTGYGSTCMVEGRRVTSGEGVPPGGWLYPMPFRGQRADDCFSRRGLEARLQVAGASTNDVKVAAAAARNGNQTALQTFREFGADLGAFLQPFAVSFHAEAVLVLGGIAGAFDLFGPLLSRALSVPALVGELGNDAALLGAAELLFDEGAVADM